jgi:hypothetical protein
VTALTDVVVCAIPRREAGAGLADNNVLAALSTRRWPPFSDRLRKATDTDYDDELDDSVLDNVDRAGALQRAQPPLLDA